MAAAAAAARAVATAAWRPGGLALPRHRRRRLVTRSAASSADDEAGQADLERLNRMLAGPQQISGTELRDLVFDKWGRNYDVRLQRRGQRMYLHVMWRYLEQQSFPLTEQEYQLQLDAVAEYLNLWSVQDTVRAGITTANKRGPGYTGGGNARAISIPLGVDVGGTGRADEWNSF